MSALQGLNYRYEKRKLLGSYTHDADYHFESLRRRTINAFFALFYKDKAIRYNNSWKGLSLEESYEFYQITKCNVVKEILMHGFWPNKIWYKFNIYPAHSCGFFVKKKLHKKIGLYDTKFKYSSDRDFIFKMIKRKFVGMNTKKYEIFGKFNPYGVSSKLGFFKGFKEEIRVRLNNQNILFVILLSFITLLYGLLILLLKKK